MATGNSSIDIALNLIAQSTGISALTGVISALSALGDAATAAAALQSALTDALAAQELSATRVSLAQQALADAQNAAGMAGYGVEQALIRQESAAIRTTEAEQALADAQAAVGTAGTQVEQSLVRQENAAFNLMTAQQKLADAEAAANMANLKGLSDEQKAALDAQVANASYNVILAEQQQKLADLSVVSAQEALVKEQNAQAGKVAQAEYNLQLAQQQQELADLAVLQAQDAAQKEQTMLAAKEATAQYNLSLAEEAARQADLNVQQAQAAIQAQAATLATQQYTAALVAAGVEALAFDLALKTVIGDAANLQQSTAAMDLSLHGTQAQIDQLNPKIIEWADNSLYTTTQVHQLVQALSEHGLDVSSILNGNAVAAIQMGEAMQSDPVPAANLLGSTLQMFSGQGLTATQVANDLTAAFYNGVPSAQDLQTGLDMVGGRAATLNITLPDLLANIDLLAQAGLTASSAGASLNYTLQQIADPTTKASNTFNELGLIVVHNTSPAVEHLTALLQGSGVKAAKEAAAAYDGTTGGLNAMFKEAQKLGLLPMNETFNTWALSSGALSSTLFDSNGNLISLGDTVSQIIDAIQTKAHGNKELMAQYIGDMFNVRSGRAMQILAEMQDYKQKYNTIIGEIGKTSVSQDAQKMLDTLGGAWKQFQTTMTSFASTVGTTFLPLLTGLVQGLNNLVSVAMKHPELTRFLAIFIGIGAVLSTILVIVLGAVVVFGILTTVVAGPVLAAFGIAFVAILAVAAVIAGLVVGVKYAYDHFGWFHDAVDNARKAIGKFHDEIMVRLAPVLHNLQVGFQTILPYIQLLWNAVWPQMKDVLEEVWGVICGIVTIAWNILKGIILVGLDILSGNWKQAWSDMQASAMAIWGGVQLMFGSILKGMTKQALDWAKGILQALALIPGPIGDMAKKAIDTINHMETQIDGDTKKMADSSIANSATMRAGVGNETYQMQQDQLKQLEDMKKNVEDQFGKAKDAATKKSLEMKLNVIQNQIDTKKAAIQEAQQLNTGVTQHMQQMHDKVVDRANATKGDVSGKFKDMSDQSIQHTSDMQTGMDSKMAGLHVDMSQRSTQIAHDIGYQLGGLAAVAPTWGFNMIQGFVQGMFHAMPSLTSAVMGAASIIARNLGHHSPPPEGPLADDDQYMPNMMRMFGAGISGNQHLLLNPVTTLARGLSSGLSQGMLPGVGFSSLQAQSLAGGGNQTINLNVDGRPLYQITMDRLGHDLRMNSLGTQWR